MLYLESEILVQKFLLDLALVVGLRRYSYPHGTFFLVITAILHAWPSFRLFLYI